MPCKPANTALLVVLTAILFWCSPAGAGKPCRIATVAWMGWSPLHVAAAQGFWRARGLAVEVVTYDDPIVILEAMKAGRVDFAMDMAGSLVGIYMAGEPVVVVAETNWSHGGDKIILRRGDYLKNHIGGVIGVFLDQPSCLYFLGRYLETVGLRLGDFRIVEINPRDLSAQFIAGRLPAIVNYAPWADAALVRGNGVARATSADFEGCIPECLWAYRKTLQKLPSRRVQALLHGWIDAVQWLQTPGNRAAYYRILRARTFKGEPELSDAYLAKMAGEVRIHNVQQMAARNRDGGGLLRYLADLKRFLSENNRRQTDWHPAEIFDNRYIVPVLNRRIKAPETAATGRETDK